jgi:hypothetical protein
MTPPPLLDVVFDRPEKVVHFVFDFELAVPRHPETDGVADHHPGEQVGEVQADDVFQRAEREHGRFRFGVGGSGQRHEPGQHAGHLHHRVERFRVAGTPQQHRQVQRLVRQVRERVSGVDGQRGQHRKDLRPEYVLHVPVFFGGQVFFRPDHDPTFAQLW